MNLIIILSKLTEAVKISFFSVNEDNRKRQFIFEELASTDPVLVTVQPYKLVQAYQQALLSYPSWTKEKEIMRAYLRQTTI